MESDGNKIEYNSADIRKKPKEKLITNIRKLSSSEKMKNFFTVDNKKLIAAVTLVLIALAGLVVAIIMLTSGGEDTSTPLPPDEQELVDVENRVDSIAPDADGQDNLDTIDEIDERIAAAEEAGNEQQAYNLKLAKIDAFIKAGLHEYALEDPLLSLIAENREDPTRLYDLYSRAITIYMSISDSQNERLFLEKIVDLPDNVFPRTTNNTWKAYYQKQLAELKK